MPYFEKFMACLGIIVGLAVFLLFVWYIALPLLALLIVVVGIAGFVKKDKQSVRKKVPTHPKEKIIDVEFTEVK